MNKTSKIVLVLVINIFAIILSNYLVYNCDLFLTTSRIVNRINNNNYDVSFDLDNKKIIIDGVSKDITDALKMSNEELSNLINNNEFESFINNNFIGDITNEDGKISIKNPYSTKKLIVKVKDKSTLEKDSSIKEYKKITKDLYIIKYKDASNTKEGYDKLKDNDKIANVITDKKVHLQKISEDSFSWGVTSTGLNNYTEKIEYTNNNKIIRVAVLDTGIYAEHEVFMDNVIGDRLDTEYSYNYAGRNSNVSDTYGHGTKVAGIIAESTPSNVKIVPLKVMNGEDGDFSDVLEAVFDIYEYVDIINLSLGTDEFTEEDKRIIDGYLEEVRDFGTIIVAATGNNSKEDVIYPASSPLTIAVSSIDENNIRPSWSNYGTSVDFAMPGVNLMLPGLNSPTYYSNCTSCNGTSFSCPFLTSAVALIKLEYDNYDLNDVINELKNNTDDLGTPGRDIYYGYGTVNFNNHKFLNPTILETNVKNINYTHYATVNIKAFSKNEITKYSVSQSTSVPSKWSNIDSPSKYVDFDINVTNNGTNYLWVKDSGNKVKYEQVEINHHDEVVPVISSFNITNAYNNSITVNLEAMDLESGLSKIKWYYKKEEDNNYSFIEEVVSSNGSFTHSYENLDEYTNYILYAEVYDCDNNHIQSDKVSIRTKTNVMVVNNTLDKASIKIDNNIVSGSINTNSNNVIVESNEPCVVINEHGGNYDRLNATKISENKYTFTVNDKPEKIIISLVGDVNLNGEITVNDALIIKKSLLDTNDENYRELNSIEMKIADIDKNGIINDNDVSLIRKSRLSSNNNNYVKLSW